MNYYLLRNLKTKEAECVFSVDGYMIVSEFTESITQAEYETYKEFGLPEAETRNGEVYGEVYRAIR